MDAITFSNWTGPDLVLAARLYHEALKMIVLLQPPRFIIATIPNSQDDLCGKIGRLVSCSCKLDARIKEHKLPQAGLRFIVNGGPHPEVPQPGTHER